MEELLETIERVTLSDVTLSCIVAGEGPLVIAAHGFPDDARTFGAQVPALVAAGYRVVSPTLRGYSPSGISRSGRHDAVAAGEDLLELADHYSPGVPVRLIGHDWGAVAAFAAAALAPARFSHLATLAVPHLRAAMPHLATAAQLRRSWYMGLFQLPGIAEARLRARDFELIDILWRDWSPGYRASPEDLRSIKDGIRDRVGPVLSYYRALLSPRVLRRTRLLFAPTGFRPFTFTEWMTAASASPRRPAPSVFMTRRMGSIESREQAISCTGRSPPRSTRCCTHFSGAEPSTLYPAWREPRRTVALWPLSGSQRLRRSPPRGLAAGAPPSRARIG